MDEQTALFAIEPAQKKTDNVRRRWENGFQRWSNEKAYDGSTAEGACGFGVICDYCEDNTYGRPCVRAWNGYGRRVGSEKIMLDTSPTLTITGGSKQATMRRQTYG